MRCWPQLVKQLADDIREKVKSMGYDRYKLVVQVELGEKKGQAINMVSRCLWDTNTDGFASESYESETLFCNCQARLPHSGEGQAPARLCVTLLPSRIECRYCAIVPGMNLGATLCRCTPFTSNEPSCCLKRGRFLGIEARCGAGSCGPWLEWVAFQLLD